MKVTRKTEDHLVLGDVPWLISFTMAAMIVGFLYFGLLEINRGDTGQGLAVIVFGCGLSTGGLIAFARRSQAIFDRTRSRVTRRSRSLLGYKEDHWSLEDVERAIVETLSDSDGETHRPTLLMRRGDRRVPLVLVYSSGSGAKRAADAINDWLGALDTEAEAP